MLKKMYVLGALLIEQYHEQQKQKAASAASGGKKRVTDTISALSGLLAEDTLSAGNTKLIDHAWRGAEACHFLLLAQRQLFEGNADAAMKTTLHLTEYDDILEPVEIYSFLGKLCFKVAWKILKFSYFRDFKFKFSLVLCIFTS